MDVPATLAGRADEAELQAIPAGERTLFVARRAAREGLKEQLNLRLGQLRDQIAGIEAQASAKLEELRLVKIELAAQESLWTKNLTNIAKFTAAQREAARLEGERGQLVASAAQARIRIGETELQIIQIDQDLRAEVMKELRDIQAKQAELLERRVAAEDQLQRIDITSPQIGMVHQLAGHTRTFTER